MSDDVALLQQALEELTLCPTCEGKGTWKPECYACLCGEPEKCTCAEIVEETCPQCNGTGREFSGSVAAEEAFGTEKGKP